MFSFFHKSSRENAAIVSEQDSDILHLDDSVLIAVISAAVARFREQDKSNQNHAGFVVRRVRRV